MSTSYSTTFNNWTCQSTNWVASQQYCTQYINFISICFLYLYVQFALFLFQVSQVWYFYKCSCSFVLICHICFDRSLQVSLRFSNLLCKRFCYRWFLFCYLLISRATVFFHLWQHILDLILIVLFLGLESVFLLSSRGFISYFGTSFECWNHTSRVPSARPTQLPTRFPVEDRGGPLMGDCQAIKRKLWQRTIVNNVYSWTLKQRFVFFEIAGI